MVSRMGKSGMMGKGGAAQQKQIAAQMRKNPNQMMQRLNQMDPALLQQMGGKESVMKMMQSMSGSGGAPDMESMMQSMGGMGGSMPPGMGGSMPPGMGGSMPPGMGGMDMNSISQMMASMGMGGAAQPRR